jgi:hypothetical protein
LIPRADIVAWSRSIGWPTNDQVELDLMLSRLIVELAQDPYLGEELVFRGGTCLHKLYETRRVVATALIPCPAVVPGRCRHHRNGRTSACHTVNRDIPYR